MSRRSSHVFRVFLFFFAAAAISIAQNTQAPKKSAKAEHPAPAADHHQHAFSPAYAKLQSPGFKTVSAEEVIAFLDKAGIKRAVLLSTAFRWGRPGAEPPDEYAGVRAENDWTGAQAALFPKRLIGFCSFNPVKDYALEELARCAKDPNLRRGIKMHFGNSDVQMEDPAHFEKLKKIFQAANSNRMAIVVHMRASLSKKRPYGPEQARLFLELLALTPDIPVQVAHMASSGPGFVDPDAYTVIEPLADAVEKKDPRTRRLLFDVASNAHPSNPADASALMVKLIRKIGVKRILYGTDGAAGNNLLPSESWAAFRALPLTKKEIEAIAKNVAPYLR